MKGFARRLRERFLVVLRDFLALTASRGAQKCRFPVQTRITKSVVVRDTRNTISFRKTTDFVMQVKAGRQRFRAPQGAVKARKSRNTNPDFDAGPEMLQTPHLGENFFVSFSCPLASAKKCGSLSPGPPR